MSKDPVRSGLDDRPDRASVGRRPGSMRTSVTRNALTRQLPASRAYLLSPARSFTSARILSHVESGGERSGPLSCSSPLTNHRRGELGPMFRGALTETDGGRSDSGRGRHEDRESPLEVPGWMLAGRSRHYGRITWTVSPCGDGPSFFPQRLRGTRQKARKRTAPLLPGPGDRSGHVQTSLSRLDRLITAANRS